MSERNAAGQDEIRRHAAGREAVEEGTPGQEAAESGTAARDTMPALSHEQVTAVWVGSFFDELVRWGVRDVVVSPGSRSTALAMTAYELSRRNPDDLRLHVDIDERGTAFFGLGLAKASGRPVALVCTSGTAPANCYPAVIEAETSRVPLIVLSGDRPPRLRGLGAPQTTDQLKLYGDHVRAFREMPLPGASERDVMFARQAAREACLAALGGRAPFAEANACLKPDPNANPGSNATPSTNADPNANADLSANAGSSSNSSPNANTGPSANADPSSSSSPNANAGSSANTDPNSSSGSNLDVAVASRACVYVAAPVHVNFPFEEPLKPDFAGIDAFGAGRGQASEQIASPISDVRTQLTASSAADISSLMSTSRVLALVGEGTCSTLGEAREVAAWAHARDVPLLADSLSGLRLLEDDLVIDNYDGIFEQDDCPLPDLVIRFGRYPVSKRTAKRLLEARTTHGTVSVAVDAVETRDFNYATDMFVPISPLDFVRSDEKTVEESEVSSRTDGESPAAGVELVQRNDDSARWDDDLPQRDVDLDQRDFAREWTTRNDAMRTRILAVEDSADADQLEGAYVRRMLELAPAGSCVFSANSMAVRALDTFFVKDGKPLCVLCNRGQNGIDGTLSTALGAAREFAQTTCLTGDIALLHDLNAFAMQRELLRAVDGTDEGSVLQSDLNGGIPSIVVVLLNNDGGAIFDMLPQASDDPYFERLFLTPQDVDFGAAAQAFHIPHHQVTTVEDFDGAYRSSLGVPGISLIEVRVPLRGVKERYHV